MVELGDLRERGLLGIDDDEPNRKRKELRELTSMANQYCLVTGLAFNNRIDQVGRMLHDALAAYAEAGNAKRAAVFSRLLEPSITMTPREVLSSFRGDENWTPAIWKNNWDTWRRHFVRFLIGYVTAAGVAPESATTESQTASDSNQASRPKVLRQVNRELSSISYGSSDRTPNIGRMAREYCDAKGLTLRDRGDQVTRLLRDGLQAFSNSGHVEDSHLLSQLLLTHSEPFQKLWVRLGFRTRDEFRVYWTNAGPPFAEFLVSFAMEVIASRQDLPASPIHAFAWELRRLRQRAGNPSYAEMEWMSMHWMNSKPGTSTPQRVFAQAEGGDWLPAWRTVEVYVKTCGGDPAEWRARWNQLRSEFDWAGRRKGAN